MVARVGVGEDTVARIWFDHGLKPWTLDTFKPATIPLFELRETGAASLASPLIENFGSGPSVRKP